jgi:hypothetical protein
VVIENAAWPNHLSFVSWPSAEPTKRSNKMHTTAGNRSGNVFVIIFTPAGSLKNFSGTVDLAVARSINQ